MKISILTYGSRGDVQPFIPLSLSLMKRGHSVKLAAPLRFASFMRAHDHASRTRAEEIGQELKNEDGIGKAVEFIEESSNENIR